MADSPALGAGATEHAAEDIFVIFFVVRRVCHMILWGSDRVYTECIDSVACFLISESQVSYVSGQAVQAGIVKAWKLL